MPPPPSPCRYITTFDLLVANGGGAFTVLHAHQFKPNVWTVGCGVWSLGQGEALEQQQEEDEKEEEVVETGREA